MGDAVKPLTDAELAYARANPRGAHFHNDKWLATIDALKATPSQSDVEVAREWLQTGGLHFDRDHIIDEDATAKSLAPLLASRGTRTLTEEERAYLKQIAECATDHTHKLNFCVNLISRLTGESET